MTVLAGNRFAPPHGSPKCMEICFTCTEASPHSIRHGACEEYCAPTTGRCQDYAPGIDVVNCTSCAAREWDAAGNVSFVEPYSVALDPGQTRAIDPEWILVVDRGDHCVRQIFIHVDDTMEHRRVTVNEKVTSRTIAGNCGEAGASAGFLDSPEDVAISPGGSWAVIADTGNHVLLLIEGLRSSSVQSSLLAGTVGQEVTQVVILYHLPLERFQELP